METDNQPIHTGAVAGDAPSAPKKTPAPAGELRLLKPQRTGVVRVPCDLDSVIPANHRARAIWKVVEQLDVSPFEADLRARGSHPGRPAIDRRVLIAVWIYATSEGVYEARELDRLCKLHGAYMWLCGGVPVDYHVLADLRVHHAEALDRLFGQVLERLRAQDRVPLKRTAQDGMRVRASAGAASFHREPTLQKHLEEARQQVQELPKQQQESTPKPSARSASAQVRAAREHVQRLDQALEELPKVRQSKKEPDKAEARASTTDPEARVMKMGDGGFRPAFNVQFTVDTDTRVIAEVGVTNSGSDQGQLEGQLDAIQARHGRLPQEHLVDGGFARKESIEDATSRGVTIYAPVQKPKRSDVNPHEAKPDDSKAVAAWRERMGTAEAKEIYKHRAATVETVNGDAREHRGLDRFVVRGLKKIRCVVLWFAATYNLLKLLAMVPA